MVGIFLSLLVPAIKVGTRHQSWYPPSKASSLPAGWRAVALIYTMRLDRCASSTKSSLWWLVDIAICALLGACVSLLKVLADPYNHLSIITFWLLGSLANTSRADLLFILLAVIIAPISMVLLRRQHELDDV